VGRWGLPQKLAWKTIQLGLVCLPGEEFAVRRWFDSIHKPLLNDESNARRFREFPGVEKASVAALKFRIISLCASISLNTPWRSPALPRTV